MKTASAAAWTRHEPTEGSTVLNCGVIRGGEGGRKAVATKPPRHRTENGGAAIAMEAALASGTRQGHNQMT
jgi:hypothetical protein